MVSNTKRFLIFAAIFIFLITTPVVSNIYYNFLLAPPNTNDQQSKIFVIPPRTPVVVIAKNLKEEGLIKNALAFRLLVAQMGIGKNIQAGDFRLSSSMSSRQIAEELTHGAIDVWITLPEGLRVEEQAAIIESKLKFGAGENYQFEKNQYLELAQEGYMFPDTYLIARDATTAQIVQKLKETFDLKVDGPLFGNNQKYVLTKSQIITLASLVEREARTAEEKPAIAGILINRLNLGIALQVDATVQYAKGYDNAQNTWWPQITVEDYKSVKSPYNTYLNPSLPPKPIANPGLESIKAVIKPQETDYLYYLHDSEGKIHYAKTIEEHNKNIKEFLST